MHKIMLQIIGVILEAIGFTALMLGSLLPGIAIMFIGLIFWYAGDPDNKEKRAEGKEKARSER